MSTTGLIKDDNVLGLIGELAEYILSSGLIFSKLV